MIPIDFPDLHSQTNRGELSAVIAQLISKGLWVGGSGREELMFMLVKGNPASKTKR